QGGGLAAVGPGTLVYRPAGPVAQGAKIAIEALSNFHYSTLAMTVEGGARSEARVGLTLEGANPDFHDGFPVVFELNATGEIGRMMNDGLAVYKVPDQIRDRMNRFGE
ncbi:MAG: YdbH domain-containing protein, partial [Alphaproteobacteria bacterium]|nr:YdbH domain-containing protein [Alphaproteobacteria bacterium]